jgi:hypothetical protein
MDLNLRMDDFAFFSFGRVWEEGQDFSLVCLFIEETDRRPPL